MTINAVIRAVPDTAANWTANNPTLPLGVIGYETDTRQFKFGDGATAWTGLSYGGTLDPDVADFAALTPTNDDVLQRKAGHWTNRSITQLLADLGIAATYAPLSSPALIGTPTAPTAAPGTNTTQVSTTAFVAAAIAALIGTAPGVLDTLGEISDAINDDANLYTTLVTALAGKQPLDADLTTLAGLASIVNLTALAGLSGAADKLAYFTGAGALSLADLSSFARTLLDDADALTMQNTLLLPTLPYRSGKYYPIHPVIASGTGTASGAASGLKRFCLMKLRRAVSIATLGVRVSTLQSGGKFQLALYAADTATLLPTGNPLFSSADLSTTLAQYVESGTVGQTLGPGIYWVALDTDTTGATAVFMGLSASATAFMHDIGMELGNSISTSGTVAFSKTGTYATWPTMTGSYSGDSLANVSNGLAPFLGFKVT